MVFGQLVLGPPGSGKTTYCNGMQQFLKAIGRYCVVLSNASSFLLETWTCFSSRDVAVINMDPANDQPTYVCYVFGIFSRTPSCRSYECAVDIMDLISLEEVMDELNLGPNGGMCNYSMTFCGGLLIACS